MPPEYYQELVSLLLFVFLYITILFMNFIKPSWGGSKNYLLQKIKKQWMCRNSPSTPKGGRHHEQVGILHSRFHFEREKFFFKQSFYVQRALKFFVVYTGCYFEVGDVRSSNGKFRLAMETVFCWGLRFFDISTRFHQKGRNVHEPKKIIRSDHSFAIKRSEKGWIWQKRLFIKWHTFPRSTNK